MPRTVDEILAHADKLAERFEDYEPRSEDELDAEPVATLHAAVTERANAERRIREAVGKARKSGLSWSTIGTFIGTSGEAARQRYSDRAA